ncbi:N-acetylmuramoyl-L-alanine amidase [Pseudomonas entomophila]|uniref:N-acetylmuramoyl-L-alanine amidase n=1 Tax=Pseudomonas entomophila TaxID=312306 RepID=UPI0023D7BE32|nr:N-acetylmuramoyl-L-alanine amidase [Pseudomonas entomophila]MDF0733011.1 N-acetylmuramoyl-L-alanine amidase [Pseudomonas entomophila]
MDRRRFLHLLFAGCALPLGSLAQARTGQWVRAASLQRGADGSTLLLDLSGPVAARTFTLEAPPRLVIDLPGTGLATRFEHLALQGSPVRAIRSAATANGDLRIVLDLSEPALASDFKTTLKNRQLAIRLGNPPLAKAVGTPRAPQGRDLLIVIDAGHGGKDPGAVGSAGEQEKLVALAIARALARRIDAQKGFKARLVRNQDVFIPLRKRAEMAQRLNADLFISVHADAAPRRTASGASVFALSEHGATSTVARWMAQRENAADFVGVSAVVKQAPKDPVVAGVLLDMSMNATLSTSLDLGHAVLGQLEGVAGLHQARVEQAGFAVLKSPTVPSILVETGFMSNARDCQRLQDPRHQRKVADAIFAGLASHFRQRAPQGSYLATLAGA